MFFCFLQSKGDKCGAARVIPGLSSPLALHVTPFLFLSAVSITHPPHAAGMERERQKG